jgi:hypothetical protein
MATLTPESDAGVCVVRKHYLLVRYSRWLNVPILPGLMGRGESRRPGIALWSYRCLENLHPKGGILTNGERPLSISD